MVSNQGPPEPTPGKQPVPQTDMQKFWEAWRAAFIWLIRRLARRQKLELPDEEIANSAKIFVNNFQRKFKPGLFKVMQDVASVLEPLVGNNIEDFARADFTCNALHDFVLRTCKIDGRSGSVHTILVCQILKSWKPINYVAAASDLRGIIEAYFRRKPRRGSNGSDLPLETPEELALLVD